MGTELAILVSGDINNIVSMRVKDFLSMLPGAERLENKVDKENVLQQTAELIALHGALREATEVSPKEHDDIGVEPNNGVINRSRVHSDPDTIGNISVFS